MIILVPLQCEVVDDGVSLDVGGVGAVLHDHRGPVEVDAVVDDQERVAVVDDVVVDGDTIQVLLQQVLEEEILLLEGGLLLLNRKLVQVDLVVTLVEVVERPELVVGVGVNAQDFLDGLIRFLLGVRVALVERKNFFLFSLELTAELSSLQDALT